MGKLEKKTTASGAKAYQREDKEDRTLLYRNWRREVVSKGSRRSTCYTSDLDQIEYVIINDEVHPVAIFELTRYDDDENNFKEQSWAKYRSAILDRFFYRDAQGKFVRKMASLLGIPAFIVLFRKDLESFWTFEMTDNMATWKHKTPEEYRDWLAHLKTTTTEKIKNGK